MAHQLRLPLAVLALASLFFGGQVMAIETPNYNVLYEDAGIEYRQYSPYLVAETIVLDASGYKASGNEGFRRLFKYITGTNEAAASITMTAPVSRTNSGEKISMTSPVERNQTQAGEVVSFMLPSQYTLESAPLPRDGRVKVKRIPSKIVATIRYRGRWTDANYQEYRAKLLAGIKDQGLKAIGNVQSALYDAPYVPPFMRRNEVMVEVGELPAIAQKSSIVGTNELAVYR
jgi:hypothetical protein